MMQQLLGYASVMKNEIERKFEVKNKCLFIWWSNMLELKKLLGLEVEHLHET